MAAKMTWAGAAGVLVLLPGCAAPPTPAAYARLSCADLAQEVMSVQRTLVAYSGLPPEHPAAQTPGFLLWPAFSFLEDQLGRDTRFDDLRLRYLAQAEASADKACPMSRPPSVNQVGVPPVPPTVDQVLDDGRQDAPPPS